MASLTAIRESIARIVNANTSMEIYTYDTVADMGQLPAMIVEPVSSDFDVSMQRGTDTWELNLFILVSRADSATGQNTLDQLVSGAGPNSIREIIYAHSDLGLDDTEAHVHSLKGYGGSFEWAKIPHIGAILNVRVYTNGHG